MDVKITKGRLVNLISYDFLKIILSVLAGIMVWVFHDLRHEGDRGRAVRADTLSRRVFGS